MFEHFILLVILNVTAHYNNGLTHQEHKKPAQQCKNQNSDPAYHQHLKRCKLRTFYLHYKFSDQNIVGWFAGMDCCRRFGTFGKANDESRDLRLKYVEIIG